MQYAKLWKRILNHGLFMVGDTFLMSKETLERIIIEATIIVNPRPMGAASVINMNVFVEARDEVFSPLIFLDGEGKNLDAPSHEGEE